MLTASIENALNRGLPRSPRAQQLCGELAGQRIAIEIPDIGRVLVESTGHSLRLTRMQASEQTATDAQITGGPFGLLALGGDSPQAVLQRRGVEIRGDAGIAARFRELAMLLRPDFEEDLSRLVGDVPAHKIAHFARRAFSWGREAASTTASNFAEYFAHEKRDLVSRNEGEQFLRGVDTLREDVDRLEARLAVLTRA